LHGCSGGGEGLLVRKRYRNHGHRFTRTRDVRENREWKGIGLEAAFKRQLFLGDCHALEELSPLVGLENTWYEVEVMF
jgi:hypothetical protein